VRALQAIRAHAVVLLANHPSVGPAARDVAQLVPGRNVTVIETRNAAEGIAAALALDPHAPVDRNLGRIDDALETVQTLRVSRELVDGAMLVLDPEERIVAAAADPVSAALAGIDTLADGWELLTLYVGSGVDPEAVEAVRTGASTSHPDAAIEVVDGGQPRDVFLVAAE
jgi:dihydroxyacetone kinase-like predicted kinase